MGQEHAREDAVASGLDARQMHSIAGVSARSACFSRHSWPCGHTQRNPRRPLDSLRPMRSMCTRGSGGVMKCVACGAAMRLMQVETDTVTVCGIERHIFRCSACPQGAQRLMFNRARMSGIHLPDAATARPEPPAIKLQAAQVARPRRMDASDREARQQTDGAQGTKGGGTDFGPVARGQDTNHEHTDRAQSDAGASQAVGQQFPGLDERDREARQQADGSPGAKGSGTDFGPAVRGQDTTQQRTDRAQSDAGGSQAVGQQLPGLDEGGREAPQQTNPPRASSNDRCGRHAQPDAGRSAA